MVQTECFTHVNDEKIIGYMFFNFKNGPSMLPICCEVRRSALVLFLLKKKVLNLKIEPIWDIFCTLLTPLGIVFPNSYISAKERINLSFWCPLLSKVPGELWSLFSLYRNSFIHCGPMIAIIAERNDGAGLNLYFLFSQWSRTGILEKETVFYKLYSFQYLAMRW